MHVGTTTEAPDWPSESISPLGTLVPTWNTVPFFIKAGRSAQLLSLVQPILLPYWVMAAGSLGNL